MIPPTVTPESVWWTEKDESFNHQFKVIKVNSCLTAKQKMCMMVFKILCECLVNIRKFKYFATWKLIIVEHATTARGAGVSRY